MSSYCVRAILDSLSRLLCCAGNLAVHGIKEHDENSSSLIDGRYGCVEV